MGPSLGIWPGAKASMRFCAWNQNCVSPVTSGWGLWRVMVSASGTARGSSGLWLLFCAASKNPTPLHFTRYAFIISFLLVLKCPPDSCIAHLPPPSSNRGRCSALPSNFSYSCPSRTSPTWAPQVDRQTLAGNSSGKELWPFWKGGHCRKSDHKLQPFL